MKLFLTALCATWIIAPLSFAKDCDKGKCDKDKKNEPTLVDCGKCKKSGDCDKKDGDCHKDKKEGTSLAACGKCKKDADKDKEKKEGTFV